MGFQTLFCAIYFAALIVSIDCDGTICEGATQQGYEWPDTEEGNMAALNCNSSGSFNLQGVINRLCRTGGIWEELDLSECMNPMFEGIDELLNSLEGEVPGMISVSDGTNLANMLVSGTRAPQGSEGAYISPTALKSSVAGLQLLEKSIIQKTGQEKRAAVQSYGSQWFESCSNVLDSRNAPSYMSSGVNALALTNDIVGSIDGVTGAYGEFSTSEQMIEHRNLQVVGGPVQEPSSGQVAKFPTTMSMSGGEIVEFDSESLATLKTHTGTQNVNIGMCVSAGLSDIVTIALNSSLTGGKEPIGKFVTVGVGGQQRRIEFTNPINITFNLSGEESQFSNAAKYSSTCGYWNTSVGIWKTDGLSMVSGPATNKFVCSSSHLTSFSVLVKTNPFNADLSYAEELALSIVTYTLSIVSLIALVSAIVVFLMLGKDLFKKDLYMVHLNFAISLTVSQALFIFGVQTARNNYVACGIIAGMLHYTFLSVFTWSFCEAVQVMYMLFVLFATRKIYPYLMLVGWGLPFPVVIITLIFRWYNYGVLGEYCWLSTENGVIWSFIGPALILVFINFILLIISVVRILTGLKAKMRQMSRVKQAKALMIGTLILVPLLGIPWIVAVLNFFVSISLFQWLFVLLNTPQGLMFFLLYVLNNRDLLKKAFRRKEQMRSTNQTEIQRRSQYSPKRSVAQFRKQSTQSLELSPSPEGKGGEAKFSFKESDLPTVVEKDGSAGVGNPTFSNDV